MSIERTSVGLDVHARTTVGAAIDERTGELVQRRMGADTDEIVAWVTGLAGPVVATYEAGPTGSGSRGRLTAAGVRAVVAAPSKLQRPVGDRAKTDMRDAVHLARLLRLGEVVEVIVPSIEAESRWIWSAPAKTREEISCRPAIVSASCSCGKESIFRREGLDRRAPGVVAVATVRACRLAGCVRCRL